MIYINLEHNVQRLDIFNYVNFFRLPMYITTIIINIKIILSREWIVSLTLKLIVSLLL